MKIIIYCWKSNQEIDWGNWNRNIKIRQLPFSKYYQKFWSKCFYLFWIKIDNPFCVLINFLYHGESILPKKLNYIYVLHSPSIQVPKRYDYIKKKVNNFKNMTFVAVSNYVKQQALKYIPENKIRVIYNGVNINTFKPKNKISTKNFRIITLAALEKRKRIQNVIKILKDINDPNIYYDIYGDGSFKKNIKDLIQNYKLENQIKLNGICNFPENFLIKYDLFILLSKGEAFPIAPLEAMSCGLPVIVSKDKPYNEFISEKCGILVDPDSQNDILDAIMFMKNKSKRLKLGLAARNVIINSFSLKLMKDKYLELIHN